MPKAEKEFVAHAIAPTLRRLKAPSDLDDFLSFASLHGADRLLFPGQLAKVLRGEPPPSYIVALLMAWQHKP